MRAPRWRAQERLRQQPDEVVALDEAAVLVEEEAAVDSPRPRPDRRRRRALRIASTVLARFSSSIGLGTPFGNDAVGLVIDLDELERQVRLELIDDQSGAAVAGIDDDLERA